MLHKKQDELAFGKESCMASVVVADDSKGLHLVPKSPGVIPALGALILRDIGEFPAVRHLMQKSGKDAPEWAVQMDSVDVDLLSDCPIVTPEAVETQVIHPALFKGKGRGRDRGIPEECNLEKFHPPPKLPCKGVQFPVGCRKLVLHDFDIDFLGET